MEWRDHAIVLSARAHGEGATVVSLLTKAQGRHAGLLRGGQSQRLRAVTEPGTIVEATWRARLSDQLGSYTLEAERHTAAALMETPICLLALQAACAILDAALPEREPFPELFATTSILFDHLDGEVWAPLYVKWESQVLSSLGFALSLDRCAVTGLEGPLAYVSPRTGRAVSEAGAGAYKEKLLRLPGFLNGGASAETGDVLAGLRLTGHFLERHVFALINRPLPASRERFVDSYRREHAPSSNITNAPQD